MPECQQTKSLTANHSIARTGRHSIEMFSFSFFLCKILKNKKKKPRYKERVSRASVEHLGNKSNLSTLDMKLQNDE